MNRILTAGVVAVSMAAHAQPTPTELPDLTIQADGTALPSNRPRSAPAPQTADSALARELATLPGLHLRTQGGHGGEPVIRGLGWERVSTRYNGLPLYGACPSRMDPPVNLFHPTDLSKISVDIGPASVTRGPLNTAGALNLEDRLELPDAPTRGGEVSAGYQTDGDARRASLKVEAGTPDTSARVRAGAARRGDRESGNGARVPANRENEEIGARITRRIGPSSILEADIQYAEERDIDYPALPMDSRWVETLLGTTRWTWKGAPSDTVSGIDLRLGAAATDHLMDNRDKPNRARLEASTPSESDSQYASLLLRGPGLDGQWRAGIDGSRLERDATRTRRILAAGKTFRDPIWPNPTHEQLGVFLEWQGPLAENFSLRAGARADHWRTDASRADERIVPGAGFGPTTVEQAYRDVGGLRGDVEQTDWLGGGNARLSYAGSDTWTLHLSGGFSRAAPNLTQRYFAFGPRPGGYGIGTPDLDPESKQELELRLEHQGERLRAGAALFGARIDDYHLPVTVARMDVNGDGTPNRVRGTENRDAALWGAEAEAVLQLSPGWRVPLHAEWVHGEERETGDPLPEMPPFETTASLEWAGEGAWRPTGRLQTRYVHKQTRISDDFGEDATPSFTLVHLRGTLAPAQGLTLEFGIENLLDREYHEHLTRETLLPVGDLAAGDEIPGPGRTWYVNLRYRW